jgi:hypothetical protein
MITMRRNLAGLLSYDSIYFPSENVARATAEFLPFNRMARLFFTPAKLDGATHILSRSAAWTVLNDLRASPDKMWTGLARYTQIEIRRAEKFGDRVSIETNGSKVQLDLLRVYNNFAGAKSGVWRLSMGKAERYREYADFRVLYLDGEPAVVNMLLRDEEAGRVRGMLNASRRLEARDKRDTRIFGNLNRFLHWNNMLHYRALGFAEYDWGGITTAKSDGIAKFKLSFGGHVVEENVYFCAGSPRLARAILALFETLSVRGRHLKRAVNDGAEVS